MGHRAGVLLRKIAGAGQNHERIGHWRHGSALPRGRGDGAGSWSFLAAAARLFVAAVLWLLVTPFLFLSGTGIRLAAAVHDSAPHTSNSDPLDKYEVLAPDPHLVQAGNRGFGLQFDGEGYLKLNNFPARQFNEFSARLKFKYVPSWVPGSSHSAVAKASHDSDPYNRAEQVLLTKGGIFQLSLKKHETRTDLAYTILRAQWNAATHTWQSEYESRIVGLTAFEFHDLFVSFSEKEVMFTVNATDGAPGISESFRNFADENKFAIASTGTTPFAVDKGTLAVGSASAAGLVLDDLRFGLKYLRHPRELVDKVSVLHWQFNEGSGNVCFDRLGKRKLFWTDSGQTPVWKLLDLEDETPVVLRRYGYRNIVRLNSTVSSTATFIETRFYVNELPRFVTSYELPGCNSVGAAQLTGLKKVYHRTLLSPKIRCLLMVVDEEAILADGVTTTTTTAPRVIYGFLDGNVLRTDGMGVKTDNETFSTPTAELVIDANGTTHYKEIVPKVDPAVPASTEVAKYSESGGVTLKNQEITGLILKYSVLDSTLQRHSLPATVKVTIPARELAFTSSRYEWQDGVEGFKRCDPWDIGKTTFAAAVGFDSVERCKAECDNFSLQNPQTKYGYNPAGNSSANLALSTPACVAITYFSGTNPYAEAIQPVDVIEYKNFSLSVAAAGFDVTFPFVTNATASSYVTLGNTSLATDLGQVSVQVYVSTGESTQNVAASTIGPQLIRFQLQMSGKINVFFDEAVNDTVTITGASSGTSSLVVVRSFNGTLTPGFHNITFIEAEGYDAKIGQLSVKTDDQEKAWFSQPRDEVLSYERTPLFSYNDSFASQQTDLLRSVRCFLSTVPCTSYSFSPEGGQVFEKKPVVEDMAKELGWRKDYRRFDYIMRRVPMLWDNITNAEMLFCPEGLGTCDPLDDEYSPLAYFARNYDYQQISYGQAGAIVDMEPTHILQATADRSVVLTVDGMGATPLECVYNGIRSGHLAEVVSDYSVTSHLGSTSLDSRRVECLLPGDFVMRIETANIFVALQSPNATWTSNTLKLRIMRQSLDLQHAGSPAGIRGGAWVTSLLPVLRGTEVRGDGSAEGIWKNFGGETAYCRVGGHPEEKVHFVGGKMYCAVPHFYTVDGASLKVQVSLDRKLWTPSDTIDSLVNTYLTQESNATTLELEEITPRSGVAGMEVIVRGRWPNHSSGDGTSRALQLLDSGSIFNTLKDFPTVAGCAFGDVIVPASIMNETAVVCRAPPTKTNAYTKVMVGIVLSQSDTNVFYGRNNILTFAYFPRVVTLGVAPAYATERAGGNVTISLSDGFARDAFRVFCHFGSDEFMRVEAEVYGRRVSCHVPAPVILGEDKNLAHSVLLSLSLVPRADPEQEPARVFPEHKFTYVPELKVRRLQYFLKSLDIESAQHQYLHRLRHSRSVVVLLDANREPGFDVVCRFGQTIRDAVWTANTWAQNHGYWAVACEVPRGNFDSLVVHVKNQAPLYLTPFFNFRFSANTPPKLVSIAPAHGPSLGGTRVYLFGELLHANSGRLICRFGLAGASPVECLDSNAVVSGNPFHLSEQRLISSTSSGSDSAVDALEDEAEDLLFPDAIKANPNQMTSAVELPEKPTSEDPRQRPPLCWCYAPTAPAVEMDVRVDVGFVDDIFTTDSFPFRYTLPLPRITTIVPPYGRPGTVVKLKFDEQRSLGSEGQGLLGFCRFGGKLISPAKLYDEGFRCVVPEGLGLGEPMDLFLSLQFSDIDVELQNKLPVGNETERENYVRTNRGSFAETQYKIERDNRVFYRVARKAFEVSAPVQCTVDLVNYDDHLRKGYVRVFGEGFQPFYHKSYVPEFECVFTEAAILEFCGGSLPQIHEALQANQTCKDNYHKKRTARTIPVIQNRRLLHCPLPEDRALQGDVILQLAEKHRANSLIPCSVTDKFSSTLPMPGGEAANLLLPKPELLAYEVPQFRPLNIHVKYEATMSTLPERVLFKGASGGYVKLQIDVIPASFNYTDSDGNVRTGFSRLLNNKCVWWRRYYDAPFAEDDPLEFAAEHNIVKCKVPNFPLQFDKIYLTFGRSRHHCTVDSPNARYRNLDVNVDELRTNVADSFMPVVCDDTVDHRYRRLDEGLVNSLTREFSLVSVPAILHTGPSTVVGSHEGQESSDLAYTMDTGPNVIFELTDAVPHDTDMFCTVFEHDRFHHVEVVEAPPADSSGKAFTCSVPETIRRFPGKFRREIYFRLGLVPWHEYSYFLMSSETTRPFEVSERRKYPQEYLEGSGTNAIGGAVVSLLRSRPEHDGDVSPGFELRVENAKMTNEIIPLRDGELGPAIAYPRVMEMNRKTFIAVSRLFTGEDNVLAEYHRRDPGNFTASEMRNVQDLNYLMGSPHGIYCEFWTMRVLPTNVTREYNTTYWYERVDALMASATTVLCDAVAWPVAQKIYVKVVPGFATSTVIVTPHDDKRITKVLYSPETTDTSFVDMMQPRYKEQPVFYQTMLTFVHPPAIFAGVTKKVEVFAFGTNFPQEDYRVRSRWSLIRQDLGGIDEIEYLHVYHCVWHSPYTVEANSTLRETITRDEYHVAHPELSQNLSLGDAFVNLGPIANRRKTQPAHWINSGLLSCGPAPTGYELGAFFGVPVKVRDVGAKRVYEDFTVKLSIYHGQTHIGDSDMTYLNSAAETVHIPKRVPFDFEKGADIRVQRLGDWSNNRLLAYSLGGGQFDDPLFLTHCGMETPSETFRDGRVSFVGSKEIRCKLFGATKAMRGTFFVRAGETDLIPPTVITLEPAGISRSVNRHLNLALVTEAGGAFKWSDDRGDFGMQRYLKYDRAIMDGNDRFDPNSTALVTPYPDGVPSNEYVTRRWAYTDEFPPADLDVKRPVKKCVFKLKDRAPEDYVFEYPAVAVFEDKRYACSSDGWTSTSNFTVVLPYYGLYEADLLDQHAEIDTVWGSKQLVFVTKKWHLDSIYPNVINVMQAPYPSRSGALRYPELRVTTASMGQVLAVISDLPTLAQSLSCAFREFNRETTATTGYYGRLLGRTPVRIVSDTELTCPLPLKDLQLNYTAPVPGNKKTDGLADKIGWQLEIAEMPQGPLLQTTLTLFKPPQPTHLHPQSTHLQQLNGLKVFFSEDSINWVSADVASMMTFCRLRDPKTGMSKTYPVREVRHDEFYCVGLEAFRVGDLEVTIESVTGLVSGSVTLPVLPPLITSTSYALSHRRDGSEIVRRVSTLADRHFQPIIRQPGKKGRRSFARAELPELTIVTPDHSDYSINEMVFKQADTVLDKDRFPRRCFVDGIEVPMTEDGVATCQIPIFGDSWGSDPAPKKTAAREQKELDGKLYTDEIDYSYIALSAHADPNARSADGVVQLSRAVAPVGLWERPSDIGNNARFMSQCVEEGDPMKDATREDGDRFNYTALSEAGVLQSCSSPEHKKSSLVKLRAHAYPHLQGNLYCKSDLNSVPDTFLHREAKITGKLDLDCALLATRKFSGVQVLSLMADGVSASMGAVSVRVAPLSSFSTYPMKNFFGKTTRYRFGRTPQVQLHGREIGEIKDPFCKFTIPRTLKEQAAYGQSVYFETENRFSVVEGQTLTTYPAGSAHGVRCILPEFDEFDKNSRTTYYVNAFDARDNRVFSEEGGQRLTDFNTEKFKFSLNPISQEASGLVFPENARSDLYFEFTNNKLPRHFDLDSLIPALSSSACMFCNGERTQARVDFLDSDKPVIACPTPSLNLDAWLRCPVKVSVDGVNILFESRPQAARLKAAKNTETLFDMASDGDELSWRMEFPAYNTWVIGRTLPELGTNVVNETNTEVSCTFRPAEVAPQGEGREKLILGTFPMRTKGYIASNFRAEDNRQILVVKCPAPAISSMGFTTWTSSKIYCSLDLQYSGYVRLPQPAPLMLRAYRNPQFFALSPRQALANVRNQKVNLIGDNFPDVPGGRVFLALGQKATNITHRLPSSTVFLEDDAEIAAHNANWRNNTAPCEWRAAMILACNLPAVQDRNGGKYPVFVSFSGGGRELAEGNGLKFTGLTLELVPEPLVRSMFYAGSNFVSVRLNSGEDFMNTNRFFYRTPHGLSCYLGSEKLMTKVVNNPPGVQCLLPGMPDVQAVSVQRARAKDALRKLNMASRDQQMYEIQRPFLLSLRMYPGIRSTGQAELMDYPEDSYSAATNFRVFQKTFQSWNREVPILAADPRWDPASKLADTFQLRIPDLRSGLIMPQTSEARIHALIPQAFYNIRVESGYTQEPFANADGTVTTLWSVDSQKTLLLQGISRPSYVKVVGSGLTALMRCEFQDRDSGMRVISGSVIASEVPTALYCEVPQIVVDAIASNDAASASTSDSSSSASGQRKLFSKLYAVRLVSEEGANGLTIYDRQVFMMSLQEQPSLVSFYPKSGAVLDPAVLVTVYGQNFPYGDIALDQKFTIAARGALCKVGDNPTATALTSATPTLFTAEILSPGILQCNITGTFIGPHSFGVSFDGMNFIQFDEEFHFVQHDHKIAPERGIAAKVLFTGLQIPFKGLYEGGDPTPFCDVYDALGLYTYSTPAEFGRPQADKILEGAEDYTKASCQLDRENVTAVQLHLATVGPLTEKFVFSTVLVPQVTFVQPATISEVGGAALFVRGKFSPAEIDRSVYYYCWFSHSATLNGPPYYSAVYFQNDTIAVCEAPPGPSMRVRLRTESGTLPNTVDFYVAASYTPIPMFSLKLTYVPDPIVNYTFPYLGHTGGSEPIALVGMNFLPEESYRLQVGPRDVPCNYRSDVMLTCVTPAAEEFKMSNERTISERIKFTNDTPYEANNYTVMYTPYELDRIGNKAPLGVSFNSGFGYYSMRQTLEYFDRVIEQDGSTQMEFSVPDIGETFIGLPGVGRRGPNVVNLTNNSALINEEIICDFGRDRAFPVFVNGSYTICPTRYYAAAASRYFRVLDLAHEGFQLTPTFQLVTSPGFDVVDVYPLAIPTFNTSFTVAFRQGAG
eukprot:g4404.t1